MKSLTVTEAAAAPTEPCAWCDKSTAADSSHRGVANLPCCSERCARLSKPSPMDEKL